MEAQKIVVVSDSHGHNEYINEVIERERPFNTLVHCGDAERDLDYLEYEYRAGIDFGFVQVRGNCDYYSDLDASRDFKVGFYNIHVEHGHESNVKYDLGILLRKAKKLGADVVLFGHSHVPEIVEKDGVLLMNPGSVTLPHQEPRLKSYGVLYISDDELPKGQIKYLDE
ncbi:MAG: metallophosphoesterase [Lachnospiraceae bacterium]|nr:metallophosphoesterase [Lachnospiraceae bacterium]